jgi:hypothetical protein
MAFQEAARREILLLLRKATLRRRRQAAFTNEHLLWAIVMPREWLAVVQNNMARSVGVDRQR